MTNLGDNEEELLPFEASSYCETSLDQSGHEKGDCELKSKSNLVFHYYIALEHQEYD